MKKLLMYDKHSIGKDINKMNKSLWNWDYYNNQSVNPDRCRISELSRVLIPFEYNGIKFNMIVCPSGGEFKIKGYGEQKIKEPFMLGETEITQELFESVMDFNNSRFKDPDNPVEEVTWYDCLDFCNKLSDYFGLERYYSLLSKEFTNANSPLSIEHATPIFNENANGFRLPKEWEWQIAATAGVDDKYSGIESDGELQKFAWTKENSELRSHPVAQKLPNEWGFYDMIGNVDEWCENTRSPNEYNVPSSPRIYRGGGWFTDAFNSHASNRFLGDPNDRYDNRGFRIAKSM